MLILRRFIRAVLMVFMTALPLLSEIPTLGRLPIALFWLGVVSFLFFNISPRNRQPKAATRRLRAMIGGYELFVTAGLFVVLDTLTLIFLAFTVGPRLQSPFAVGVVTLLSTLIPLFLMLTNAFLRVILTSGQLRLVWRILLVLLWWLPLVNLFLFVAVCRIVKREYHFECAKLELDDLRQENEICRTKYPLVLVHGVFFRDWQLLNYWGRIPKELVRNGANIYYGGQQSAAAVAVSGTELKAHILKILEETGCEKVNIIAHSKGGLDSRYAISRLGLADKVCSLTTINTPHRGCVFARQKLDTMPKKLVEWIAKRYNGIFHKLGDPTPDFMAGVTDLTADYCAKFNEETPDAPNVYYQSVTAVMRGASSASFPLNLTWRLVKRWDKEANDGLVAESSAHWGNFLGVIRGTGTRGISHGDVIDLMREDIDGFDVREYYVRLVADLKTKGY